MRSWRKKINDSTILTKESLVSKETVVLRLWESETLKFSSKQAPVVQYQILLCHPVDSATKPLDH